MSRTTKRLQAAKAKIADRKNWIKDGFSKNASGIIVPSTDKNACKFCVVGALNAVVGNLDSNSLAHELLQEAAQRQGYLGPMAFNDHDRTSHPMVLNLYDRAIRASKRIDQKRTEEKKTPKKK
jgi:hypothetical protein